MKITVKILLLISLFVSNLHTQESKAIWVVRDALTAKSVSSIIDNVKTLKCNKIFIQLRALGKVWYPTKLDLPQSKIDSTAISELIQKANNNNIEVHAWLNFSYIYSKNKRRVPTNHIINKSGNAIIYSPVNGVKSEGYFLHPNDEKNLSEVKNIVKELIEEYPISGIHLDYFRYPKDLSHTSKSGRTKYIMDYGLDPLIPISDPNAFIKLRGLESFRYFKESYTNFLRYELTAALIEIRDLIKKNNNKVQLSIAVKPNPLKAKHTFYQDWAFWIANNYCDFIVIMNYSPDDKVFDDNIRIVRSLVPQEKVMVGIATYNVNKEQIVSRIKNVNSIKFKGYSLFSYNFITGNSDLFRYLTSGHLKWNSD